MVSSRNKSAKVAPLVALALFLLTCIHIIYPLFRYPNENSSSDSPSRISLKLPLCEKSGSCTHKNVDKIPTADDNNRDPPEPGSSSEKPATTRTDSIGDTEAKPAVSNPDLDTPTAAEGDVCDIFSGEWVPDRDAPYYTNTTCYGIQEHQNCMKFGRPDKKYLKWKWKPDGCELPGFDPNRFFELMRGKTLAFVGDSVGRNQMQSLMCLLSSVEVGTDISDAKDPQFRRYKYPNHDFSMEIIWSPYLVKTSQLTKEPFDVYLDEVNEKWITKIQHFDYVVISAEHWFFRPTMLYEQGRIVGCVNCADNRITHLAAHFSYRKAFQTAFRALNSLENFKGTIFIRTFAPSHFEGGSWDKGGDCPRQTPFKKAEVSLEGDNFEHHKIQIEELKIAEPFGRRKGLKYRLIDVTQAMLLRPDGHPRKYGHSPQEKVVLANDCVHWCLPGPVDTWNEFLLEMLQREEKA